jgi:hypothetical protein
MFLQNVPIYKTTCHYILENNNLDIYYHENFNSHINVFVLLFISERNWNMWIPGFGTDELRPYKRAAVTEAHKQRLALIRKALKKY